MSDVVIKVENISKQYRLGNVGTGSLSHDLNRTWHRMRGKEDPYLKIGEANDRAVKGTSEYVWALQDINFEVKQGEVLGIIGRNGAGKSTLLKILSRTTTPTTGQIKIKGRVASLLEVGTGFHPELTGRENIFLNGAILGMTKSEIKSKFDEIVDFSGVERYIDTPVKRYSSGMYVRLAFGVAAHLEPEILIVDEVLAVGDAEFQKKALGKMKDVSAKDGRTVLFVSHNMAAVKAICQTGLLLQDGKINFKGFANDVVTKYLQGDAQIQNYKIFQNQFDHHIFNIEEVGVIALNKSVESSIDEYDEVNLHTKIFIKSIADRLKVTYVIYSDQGEALFTISHDGINLEAGKNHLVCYFPTGFLNIGNYFLTIFIIQDSKETLLIEKDILSFAVEIGERPIGSWLGKEPGFIKPKFLWKKK